MTDLIHIKALSNVMHDKLKKDYREFREDWVKNEKCICVKELTEWEVLNCKHIKRALKDKFEEREKKNWNLTLLSSMDDLNCSKEMAVKFYKNFKV